MIDVNFSNGQIVLNNFVLMRLCEYMPAPHGASVGYICSIGGGMHASHVICLVGTGRGHELAVSTVMILRQINVGTQREPLHYGRRPFPECQCLVCVCLYIYIYIYIRVDFLPPVVPVLPPMVATRLTTMMTRV
jgi:hypothetical protein